MRWLYEINSQAHASCNLPQVPPRQSHGLSCLSCHCMPACIPESMSKFFALLHPVHIRPEPPPKPVRRMCAATNRQNLLMCSATVTSMSVIGTSRYTWQLHRRDSCLGACDSRSRPRPQPSFVSRSRSRHCPRVQSSQEILCCTLHHTSTPRGVGVQPPSRSSSTTAPHGVDCTGHDRRNHHWAAPLDC